MEGFDLRKSKVIILKKRPICLIISMIGLIIMTLSIVTVQDQAQTPVLSYALGNQIIVVDAGHGGVDPGAIGPGKVLEKDVTLAISRKLGDELSKAGALVIPTRLYDQDLAGDEFTGTIRQRKNRDMAKRVELAQKNNADIFISIHTNADTSRRWTGAQVFYETGKEESKTIAKNIQQHLQKELKNTSRSATAANYFLMKKTDMPAILIEVGFISNPGEEKLLCDPEYQSRIAHAICMGLVESQLQNVPDT